MAGEAAGPSAEEIERLRGSDEMLKVLLEASPDIIAVTDLKGNLSLASKAAYQMFDFPLDEELPKHNIIEFIAPEHRERLVRNLAAMPTTFQGPGEYLALHPKGRKFWIEVKGAVLQDKDGRAKNVLYIVRDVTARKESQLDLRRSEEQLALANHKLNLLGSMTRHDVLNKVTALSGYLELALMLNRDPAVEANLYKAKQASQSIHNLMMRTRTYQQVGTLEPEWIDLPATIRAELGSLDAKDGVNISMDLPEVEVRGDQLLVASFHNLLSNSLQHGGAITRLTVTGREVEGSLIITVADDGVGIPASKKEAIFEWTYGGRSGHGLNFVREVLSSYGMSIVERGEEGRGACFEIKVPRGGYRIKGAVEGV